MKWDSYCKWKDFSSYYKNKTKQNKKIYGEGSKCHENVLKVGLQKIKMSLNHSTVPYQPYTYRFQCYAVSTEASIVMSEVTADAWRSDLSHSLFYAPVPRPGFICLRQTVRFLSIKGNDAWKRFSEGAEGLYAPIPTRIERYWKLVSPVPNPRPASLLL